MDHGLSAIFVDKICFQDRFGYVVSSGKVHKELPRHAPSNGSVLCHPSLAQNVQAQISTVPTEAPLIGESDRWI